VKILLTTLAAAAVWFLPGHLAVLGLLAYVWATSLAAAGNTAKARSTEVRTGVLEGVAASHSTTLALHATQITTAQNTANTANSTANAANTAVNNLTGSQTSTNGLANGIINGHTDVNYLSNANIVGYTGPQVGGAAAHIHGASGGGNNLSVSSDGHQHTFGSAGASVSNGQHSHTV
jgi:hypothetical protein